METETERNKEGKVKRKQDKRKEGKEQKEGQRGKRNKKEIRKKRGILNPSNGILANCCLLLSSQN